MELSFCAHFKVTVNLCGKCAEQQLRTIGKCTADIIFAFISNLLPSAQTLFVHQLTNKFREFISKFIHSKNLNTGTFSNSRIWSRGLCFLEPTGSFFYKNHLNCVAFSSVSWSLIPFCAFTAFILGRFCLSCGNSGPQFYYFQSVLLRCLLHFGAAIMFFCREGKKINKKQREKPFLIIIVF